MRRLTTAPSPSNRLGLDYAEEAARLAQPIAPVIDIHTHINGDAAAAIYRRAAELYGISMTYSMTQLEELPTIRDALGGAVRFIAVPNYFGEDRRYHLGKGYIERLPKYYELGVRIAKFWAAPRAKDYAIEMGDPEFMALDHPIRIEAMQVAHDLGMYFMVHIGDPDTWFATRYRDTDMYGTKRSQYEPLERLLDRFTQPWIAAHMAGSPEDLTFLTGLMERHSNLYLDTSATKWMVRELSKHSREQLLEFFTRFRGRVMFGSDIVTANDHLVAHESATEMQAKASSEEEAFDLYASRYWALRTMFETDYEGESPIADPDLAMVDPDRFSPMDAPILRGKSLPNDLLTSLYHDAAHALLDPLHGS